MARVVWTIRCGIPYSSLNRWVRSEDTWTPDRVSAVESTVDREYMGQWPTYDDARVALEKIYAFQREGRLTRLRNFKIKAKRI